MNAVCEKTRFCRIRLILIVGHCSTHICEKEGTNIEYYNAYDNCSRHDAIDKALAHLDEYDICQSIVAPFPP
jgi:hypothetical protein